MSGLLDLMYSNPPKRRGYTFQQERFASGSSGDFTFDFHEDGNPPWRNITSPAPTMGRASAPALGFGQPFAIADLKTSNLGGFTRFADPPTKDTFESIKEDSSASGGLSLGAAATGLLGLAGGALGYFQKGPEFGTHSLQKEIDRLTSTGYKADMYNNASRLMRSMVPDTQKDLASRGISSIAASREAQEGMLNKTNEMAYNAALQNEQETNKLVGGYRTRIDEIQNMEKEYKRQKKDSFMGSLVNFGMGMLGTAVGMPWLGPAGSALFSMTKK